MQRAREAAAAAPPNLGILLRRPFQAIVDAVDDALVASGHGVIRPSHGNVFQFVDPDGTSVAELARRAQMTKQSMAELVTHLENHGYVERAPDPRDRRSKLVRLTESGWDVVAIAMTAIDDLSATWRVRLGERRFQALQETLTALNGLVSGAEARHP